ncbi:very long chain fatty acid elongase AAEL008004-like [Temnothorax americanus]|uniref:very long chain fatty acid elongase AAEL008004-like n=1 Tax=Temnothorax americanus TaxID=1964332 RepID=UPI004069259B
MDLLHDVPYYWTKELDPRVADLPLVSSSYQIPLIIFAYLYFVLGCGSRFMKNRPPYALTTFMKLYNIGQILANVWLIYDIIDAGLFSTHSLFVCPKFDYSYNYIPMRLTRCAWYFFLLKIFDYVETIVFVLRKKDNQISGLHLYHHVSTLLLSWAGVRFYAVAPMVLTCVINCFIHTIMYTYYFLAAWGPNVQKAVAPLKRWITIAQMIQFVMLILYGSQKLVLKDCEIVSNYVLMLFVGNVVINFFMFHNFYQKTYKEVKKTQ